MGAFTLAELLAAAGIVLVLATLAVASAGRWIEGARSSACAAKLRGIGQGISLYASDHGGELPPRWTSSPWEYWYMKIYPYLSDGREITLADTSIFWCPSARGRVDSRFWRSSCTYALNYAVLGYGDNAWDPSAGRDTVNLSAFSRPSKVLAVTEWPVEVDETWWTAVDGWAPLGVPPDFHGRVVGALFLDGHVDALRRDSRDLVEKFPLFDREASVK